MKCQACGCYFRDELDECPECVRVLDALGDRVLDEFEEGLDAEGDDELEREGDE